MSAPRVAGVVLAAGASRRLGRPKQLVDAGGVPLVRRVVDAMCASSCARVGVVVGAARDLVCAAVDGARAAIVDNAAWDDGMASSIRAAIAWAEREDADAAVLAACDQPRLDAAHVDRLVAAWRAGSPLVASWYDGVRGIPALFDYTFFPRLAELRGERGAAHLLRDPGAHVACIAWPDGAFDVDTPHDARALSGR